MKYQIQTTPIIDAFKSECICPICVIYEQVSSRLVNQYLSEAVMSPDYRVQVNKIGFCSAHLSNLYNGKNKLGLALQLSTRTDALIKKLNVIKDFKSAKKQVQMLKDENMGCVICDTANGLMEKYTMTIAQMFTHEAEFPKLMSSSNGFCLPHYTLLLEHANCAGKNTAEYLTELSALQIRTLEQTNAFTDKFCGMFDYNSQDKGMKNASEAVPNAINKLKGKII